MNVTFETVICAWDEKIPELRETTELDEFFTYGYGSHHFWCNQRISKGSVQFIQSRLFIATF